MGVASILDDLFGPSGPTAEERRAARVRERYESLKLRGGDDPLPAHKVTMLVREMPPPALDLVVRQEGGAHLGRFGWFSLGDGCWVASRKQQ